MSAKNNINQGDEVVGTKGKHMKNYKGLLVAVAAVVGFTFIGTGSAMAQQNSAQASASATANIIQKIQLTKNTDLNFGDVVPSAAVGTVSVDATTAARAAAGGASLGSGTNVARATFTVTGNSGAAYSITVPASVTINSGLNSMSVALSGSKATGTLTAGTDGFGVGGVLSVGANQATGLYTNTFQVTVAYN